MREQVPGFNLFRRSSSLVANPTTQGVSLRNIGPNGAGRTLVLLDGVPQNDPFGGWVYWSRLPPEAIERVEILQGGGAGAFGNAALGGTIQLFSRQLAGDSVDAEARGGERGTYEFSLGGQKTAAGGALAFFGRADHFHTDGYPTVRADQRGPVDIAATSEADLLDGGLRWNLSASDILTLKASGFREDRGNGTPGTNNSTQAADFSAALDGELPARGIGYQLEAYGQLRDFSATFTSVNARRSQETPSLDQYDVPAQAAGGSATVSFPLGGANNRVLAGADVRWVEGETRERFRYLSGAYTRGREAGGTQVFAGAFAEDAWRPAPGTSITLSGRLDHYANTAGHRREYDLATGATTLNGHFADRDGWVADGRLGGSQALGPGGATRLRGSVYTGFRVPTLNELYRPFRVGNDITEANAALRPERLYGAELGVESQPAKSLRLTLGAYYNELQDPVANVTVANGPANVAPFGAIPAGGVGRLRENLGRADIYGVETTAAWTPAPPWQFSASYLYSHGVVAAAPTPPPHEGKRLAQAPEHQFVAGVRWTPFPKWQAQAQLRVVGDQFEDDLNTQRLAPYATVDVAVSYEFAAGWQARITVENLGNAEIETGKSAAGLVSVGEPRLLTVGVRWSYH